MGEDTRKMMPAVDLETVTINPTLSSGSQLAHGCTLQASGVMKVTFVGSHFAGSTTWRDVSIYHVTITLTLPKMLGS
jgi:hypothetical protein